MSNPNLPGLAPVPQVVLAAKVHAMWEGGLPRCWSKCVTHFGDDALPYHPGEKTCIDRCMHKLMEGFELAKAARRATEATVKDDPAAWQWMRDIEQQYRDSPPTYE